MRKQKVKNLTPTGGLRDATISRSKTTTSAAPGIRMKSYKSRNVPKENLYEYMQEQLKVPDSFPWRMAIIRPDPHDVSISRL